VSENSSCARYFVEELIGGAQEGAWIDSSTMEIRRRGSIAEPCAEKPAINEMTKPILPPIRDVACTMRTRPET
jgi:hypothetical protein